MSTGNPIELCVKIAPTATLVASTLTVRVRLSHLAFEISRAPNGIFDINTLHILY